MRVFVNGGTGHLGSYIVPELIEANRQLDQRRRFTETVLSGVSAGVIGLDQQGRINLPNRSASLLLGTDLDQHIGKDLAETGVLVNCVTPAVIQGRMLADMSEEHVEYMLSRIPMKRMGRPDEVAALIEYLASDQCTFSTAAVFDASGGRATY